MVILILVIAAIIWISIKIIDSNEKDKKENEIRMKEKEEEEIKKRELIEKQRTAWKSLPDSEKNTKSLSNIVRDMDASSYFKEARSIYYNHNSLPVGYTRKVINNAENNVNYKKTSVDEGRDLSDFEILYYINDYEYFEDIFNLVNKVMNETNLMCDFDNLAEKYQYLVGIPDKMRDEKDSSFGFTRVTHIRDSCMTKIVLSRKDDNPNNKHLILDICKPSPNGFVLNEDLKSTYRYNDLKLTMTLYIDKVSSYPGLIEEVYQPFEERQGDNPIPIVTFARKKSTYRSENEGIDLELFVSASLQLNKTEPYSTEGYDSIIKLINDFFDLETGPIKFEE